MDWIGLNWIGLVWMAWSCCDDHIGIGKGIPEYPMEDTATHDPETRVALNERMMFVWQRENITQINLVLPFYYIFRKPQKSGKNKPNQTKPKT